MAAKQKIDWERIEPPWRAGIKSVLQIAADYEEATGTKVSHTAINKHFKKLGVPRDLTAKVMAKADAIVSASMVSGIVSTETKASDAAIIDTSAVVVANVRLNHRTRITQGNALVELLTNQLIDVAGKRDYFEEVIEIECADDKTNERRAMLKKAVSLGTHANIAEKLASATKTWIGLERQAFSIKDESAPDPDAGLASLIAKINGTSIPIK